MSEPSRTQRYEGLFKSQTQEQFEADARSAAEHDWYPASEKWTGPVLFVVFEHDPGRRTRATAPAGAPVPASAKTPEWDGPTRKGRGRRVMLGVGIALVVVAVVVVTMVGTQLLGAPTGGQQTGGNPAATPATPAVVVPASALGPRTAAVDFFRGIGFAGVLGTMVDGRDRWRATDKRGSVAEVIGADDKITEVSLAVRMMRDEKRNNKARVADLGSLFESYAPLAAQWATDELELTDPTVARTVEQRFEDRLVRLVSMPVKGGAVVKFQVMTD